MRDKQISLFYN